MEKIADYKDTNIVVIGFSTGADTGLIFSDKFMRNNNGSGEITDLVILGGTMSGNMPDINSNLGYEWPKILDKLLLNGTDVLIVDDAAEFGNEASSYISPLCSTGTFRYESRPNQSHTGETNQSQEFRDWVYDWIKKY